jgi:integrative and conjugative element protein (TIGR02256 family)
MLIPLMGDNALVDGGMILIEPEVLATLERYRQRAPDAHEAGGILLGHRRGAHLHITEATEPTEHDIRTRTRFVRSPKGHQDVALARWGASDGTVDYLGEWHTHPELSPEPSSIDRKEWQAICQIRRPLPMVFIIAGTTNDAWFGIGQSSVLACLHIS